MTNSDPSLQQRAEAVIREITAHVDEAYLVHHIDEPIDQVVIDLCRQAEPGFSRQSFHQVLSRFVARLFAYGLSCPRRLTASQARDEAIALLEQDYRGTRSSGYEAALLDAAQAGPGWVSLILVRLAEAIKIRRRRMHVGWVFARLLDPSDWELRREVAAHLLARCGSPPPGPLAKSPGGRFVNEIPILFGQDLEIDAQLDRVCAGSGRIFA